MNLNDFIFLTAVRLHRVVN